MAMDWLHLSCCRRLTLAKLLVEQMTEEHEKAKQPDTLKRSYSSSSTDSEASESLLQEPVCKKVNIFDPFLGFIVFVYLMVFFLLTL
jgi:hypothetical protein